MARRRKWADEDDDVIARGPRRRAISEWLEDEMDEPPRRSRRHDEDERFSTLTSAISMLEDRLEHATQATGNPRRRRAAGGEGADLNEVIAQITNQQDALDYQFDGQNLSNIQKLQNQVRDLRGVVEAATRGSAYPGLGQNIHDLQQHLQQQLHAHSFNQPQTFPGTGAPMQHAFTSHLDQQMQNLGQRIGLPQAPNSINLPVPVAAGTNVAAIEALRRDVQMLRNSVRQSSETRTLQGLEAEIRSLNRKLTDGGVSSAARDIADIKARMDHLNRALQESGVSSHNSYLTKQLQALNENISRVQRPILPERLVDDIRRDLGEATRKLVPLSVHDARTLEKNIQTLAETLDSLRARQPDNGRMQSLESTIGRLSTQLAQGDVFAGMQRLERIVQELAAQISKGNENTGTGLNQKSMGMLRGFQKQLEDVKAASDASDKRMHRTLHTMQDIIVKMTDKGGAMPQIETAGKASTALRKETAPKSAIAAAREAAARASLGDNGTAEAAESSQAGKARLLEQSFADTANEESQSLRAERRHRSDDDMTNVTPFRRTKRYGSQLALAAAGFVLVIGVYNLLGPLLSGEQSATASISPPMGDTAPAAGLDFTAPQPQAQTAESAAPVQTAAIEPTVAPQKLNISLPSFPASITSQRLHNAAQNGDVRAFYEIGMRLIYGQRGAQQDAALGLEWLQLAADRQHAPALYRIGVLYSKGIGVKRDFQLAARNFVAAGDLGHRAALHDLGNLYASGLNGEPQMDKAFPLFKRAANLGLVDSQYNLAIFYANGFVGKQDLVEAYKWFAVAAQNGDAKSAKKTTEIGSRFSGKTLVKAKLAAQSFKPQALDPAANEDVIPVSAWGDTAPRTADLNDIQPGKSE